MDHQALARKWRPRTFEQMAGQEHVLRALINALNQERLHHAYLFTGTRGVGKTTIARILAKSLNCEQGITATPCNQCVSCIEVNEGRCIDLIEVDAASRTKVEDTRELLDNVQYAPTRARFKVYLIDEVHMLSGHSFNALLKTLEEPPPHVKFLLATTDPQKLPVTVLSRCLQFNLKNLSSERIADYLCEILKTEQVKFDKGALQQIGRAADGSMRDALSLTDQAIAYGNNSVLESDVSIMLGSVDRSRVFKILEALIAQDAQQVLAEVDEIANYAPNYPSILEELISILHRIAVAQVVPKAMESGANESKLICELAKKMTGEELQLFYQIALLGLKDLPLNPDQRAGLEMVLLRMIAFHPEAVIQKSKKKQLTRSKIAPTAKKPTPSGSTTKVAPGALPAIQALKEAKEILQKRPEVNARKPSCVTPAVAVETVKKEGAGKALPPAAVITDQLQHKPSQAANVKGLVSNEQWVTLVPGLGLGGMAGTLLMQCAWQCREGNLIKLQLDQQYYGLMSEAYLQRMTQALSDSLEQPVELKIQSGVNQNDTPMTCQQRVRQENLASARRDLEQDKNVRDIIEQFGAVIDPDSIEFIE